MLKNNTSEKIWVVLADDDEDERLLFSEAVEVSKVNVTLNTVPDGHELMLYLHNCQAGFPDMIFLDLNMPKKTGMECLAEIRANEKFRNIAVAIYSTSANPEEVDEAFAQGANIYISKTSQFENLKSIIIEVLGLNWKPFSSKLERKYFHIVR